MTRHTASRTDPAWRMRRHYHAARPCAALCDTDRSAVHSSLEDVLSRYWGFTAFRPLQREAMDAIVSGRDSIVVLPTGGGKSLCFQAPALVRPGVGLVVSPLISLMKDQVDTLAA